MSSPRGLLLLLGLLIVSLAPRPAAGQTVPGYLPGPAGAQVLGPYIPHANVIPAIASSVSLGPSIASGLGGIAASSAITAVGVLAAYEQKMNTIKGLTADILSAQAKVKAAITADATDKTLNLLFTPLNVVQQKAVAVQGVLAAGGAKAGQVMAGLVKIGTEIPVLLKTAAGFAAALKAAPATVAKGLLGSGLKAAASLQGLVAKLSPLLAGNKPLQLLLSKFNGKVVGMRGFFDKASGLTSGWQGINSALVDSATSIAQALGGLAGAKVGAALSAPNGALASLASFAASG